MPGILTWSWNIFADVTRPEMSGQRAGSQSPERLNAFAQCRKTSSTSTPMARLGTLPSTAIVASRSASRVMQARPFTRSVSPRVGTRKSSATWGLARMLRMPSRRLLPGRSGMTRCVSSRTRANPAGSPFGDTSQLPSTPAVPSTMNGACAMTARQWASSLVICFFSATSLGVPSSARRSSRLVTTSRNIELLLSAIRPHVEGVERTRQHRIVADGGRQLDHALEPEPPAHGLERRVVHAPLGQEVGGVSHDRRLVLPEPVEGARPDRRDGPGAHARLARLRHVGRPLEAAVALARDGQHGQLAVGRAQRGLEADVGAEVRRALGHGRAVEQRGERPGDLAAAARDLGEDRLVRGRQVLRARDERNTRHQSIAACTALLTRSIRWLCHGSGTRLLVTYANDTPESGSAQQYEEPTPPWPKVRGEASEPRPRMVSVVPRRCGPRPRCIGIPM